MMNPNPTSLNNWAECRFHMDDYEWVMKILKPNLENDTPQPFAHALAAQALLALEKNDEAEAQLDRAVDDYEKGMEILLKSGAPDMKQWDNNSAFVKASAGAFGYHKTVLTLHQRWEQYHNSPHDRFLAGVAAFNLGMFMEAIAYWAELPWPDWAIMNAYCDVALAIDRNIIPPFPLDYHIPRLPGEIQCKTKEEYVKTLCQGSVRMIILGIILDPNVDKMLLKAAIRELEIMIAVSGEWGISLARSLVRAPESGISDEVKSVAAHILFALSYSEEDGPVDVISENEDIAMLVPWIEAGDDMDSSIRISLEALRDAAYLGKEGEYGQAINRLVPLLESEKVFPLTYLLLATFYLGKGEPDKAWDMLVVYTSNRPETPWDEPKLLRLCTELLKSDEGRSYLEQLDVSILKSVCEEIFSMINAYLALCDARSPGAETLEQSGPQAEARREKEELKPVSTNVKLTQALRRMPVGWLNAACITHGLDPYAMRNRTERAEELVSFLLDPDRLEMSIEGLDFDEKELLRFLLNRDGWARFSVVAERFESMDGVGRLCSKALVVVGRAKIDNRQHKVIVIPRELRPILTRFLL